MNFVKYNSITNSYREEFIERIILEELHKGYWCVTEKIHGANFSFWYDGEVKRMAKRTCFLADDDNFYGIQNLKKNIIENVEMLYENIQLKRKRQIEYIAVFCELFGGSYPHPEVKVSPNATKVQKGVYYSPDNDFIVYDIKVDGQFLDFNEMLSACKVAGLNYVVPLFWGSLDQCLEYPNAFPSTIYKRYELPEIRDNLCEGIVIRPQETRFLSNGERVMLKSKNDRFKEKEPSPKKAIKALSEVEQKIVDEMINMVTENRYNSVVSKIGEVQMADFGEINSMMIKDIIGELMENISLYLEFDNLEKARRKMLTAMVGKKIATLIRKRLMGN